MPSPSFPSLQISPSEGVEFRKAEQGHIELLLADLRQLDADEMLASSGPNFRATLRRSIMVSYLPGAAFDSDGLMCLFGIVPMGLMSEVALPWCIGTNRLLRHPGVLTRATRNYIALVREMYPCLCNYVDARNAPSIRWLKRVGFKLTEYTIPFGPEDRPFYQFSMGL